MNQKAETRTYILEIGHERRKKKVTVPAAWKMTYGYANPGAQGGVSNPFALRFYEGNKENLRAVFDDVRSVRDSSIVIEEEVVKVESQEFYRDTPAGRKIARADMKVTEWRNPDEAPENEAGDRRFLNALPVPTDAPEL